MASWFTENSTFPMVTGVMMVAILLVLAFSSREKVMLYLAMGVAALTAATVICERVIVTDKEQVQERVYNLADAVQANDLEQVKSFVSRSRSDTLGRISSEMPRYDFDVCRVLGTNYSKPVGSNLIEIAFIVNFRVRVDNGAEAIPGHRRVILTFEKEPTGRWMLIDYRHESPQAGLNT